MPRYQVKSLSRVRIDGSTQMRAEINTAVVNDYVELLAAGVKMPHVVVFFDGSWYWLADGFHRWHAHRKAKRDRISCEVRNGTKEDAQWFAISANSVHGLRRTNEDKAKAVKAALLHPRTVEEKLSDRQIAEHVGVDQKTVLRYRHKLQTGEEFPHLTERTGKDGKTYPVPEKRTPVVSPEDADEDKEPDEVELADDAEPEIGEVVECPNCRRMVAPHEEDGSCPQCLEPGLVDMPDAPEAVEDGEESDDDALLRTIEESIRETFSGRLSVAAARLETLADNLRAEL